MNYTELRKKLEIPPIPGRKRAILISTGSFCPVHKGHLQNIDLAAKFLSRKFKIDTLVAYISPSCDSYVSHKLGNESIPYTHRFEMVKLACAAHNSDYNTIPIIPDSWEGTQPNFVPFDQVLRRFQHNIKHDFPHEHLLVLYVSGADHFNKRKLYKNRDYVGISRIGYEIKGHSSIRRNIYICREERYAKYFSDISSTAIRNARANGQSINEYTYYPVVKYLQEVLHWI